MHNYECTDSGCTQDLHHSMHYDRYEWGRGNDEWLDAAIEFTETWFWRLMGAGSLIVVLLLMFYRG